HALARREGCRAGDDELGDARGLPHRREPAKRTPRAHQAGARLSARTGTAASIARESNPDSRGHVRMSTPVPASSPRSTGATDEALVSRAAAGETGAFETLMRRHNRRLFRTARSILRDDARAEDAVQDAW